jgi:hypothetical protein
MWNPYPHASEVSFGRTCSCSAYLDKPLTISITRTRVSQTDTLTLRERGNDLDRSNGQAFVRNFVP